MSPRARLPPTLGLKRARFLWLIRGKKLTSMAMEFLTGSKLRALFRRNRCQAMGHFQWLILVSLVMSLGSTALRNGTNPRERSRASVLPVKDLFLSLIPECLKVNAVRTSTMSTASSNGKSQAQLFPLAMVPLLEVSVSLIFGRPID